MLRCFTWHRFSAFVVLPCALGLAAMAATAVAQAPLPPPVATVGPAPLSREAVVRLALENNPELAALRQQRGIAAAGVVIARTYPFNPSYEGRVEAASGPASAGVTNVVLNEHKVLLEWEVRGQGTYRQTVATAALTRTEWEIAFQEVGLASRALWAYDGVLYRREKLRLADERIRLNQLAADQIDKLREQGKLSPTDQILIRTEVGDALAQRGGAQVALEQAEFELRRATGTIQESFILDGSLEGPLLAPDLHSLLALAAERRPDLRAHQAAVGEAEARVRLELANRYGNPTVGPSYALDPTNVSSVGMTVILPLPCLNTHRGDIQQREAEQLRAVLELRQNEVLVQQEVQTAVARLQKAGAWIQLYRKTVLPDLRSGLESAEKLFAQGDPGADVLKVLEIRRNLLKGQESYLDAYWEYSQARAALAAATGDLTVVLAFDAIPPALLPR
jgi:cobalt-zinc-cadmium efflux system outer membrane protein